MSSLYFLLPALFTIFVSFLIIRGAAIALMLTGMDYRKARFQALSAFSGTGFTTKEAESVVNHPQRRKIITWLIILGNAGIVTVIVTTTSSFAGSRGYQIPINLVALAAGIFLIYTIVSRQKFTQRWERYILNKLRKSQAFEEDTTEDLLHLIEGYGLVRVFIKGNSEHINKSLAECRLKEKGLLILGIERSKVWIPNPKGDESIKEEDQLILYGPLNVLRTEFKES